TAYLAELGLEDKFVAVYAGAHGVANGLDQVLDAAEHLRDRPDIAILLIGQGKQRDALLEQVHRRELNNVFMQPSVPKVRLPAILMACDLGLQILTQISRPRWVTPNKLFDYMFAGLPTLVNFAGTCAELVEGEQVGVVSEPESAGDLAAKICYYADRPEERKAVGRRARELAWEKYDRQAIARQLIETFEQVCARRR
ncbi:MAG: glycosyltransferase family 4 protein, partial [Planctomycetes bacterium]|nr:glycosyltransferase family 4 protein [Planctomycetota bacterium]